MEHIDPPQRHKQYGKHLGIAVVASGTVLIVELWAALKTGSLALLSDAGHLFVDLSGLLIAYGALRLASRPATPRATYGFTRAEVLAAALNGILLLGIAGGITYGAFRRLQSPLEHLDTNLVLVVAVIGLLANLWAARLLHEHSDNINAKGALLNVLGDALASIGVIISALLVKFTGDPVWDTIVSILVAGIIAYTAVGLLRNSFSILLETSPPHILPADVKRAVESHEDVRNVHDLHIWTHTPGVHSATMHVSIRSDAVPRFFRVTEDIEGILRERFGLDHATIQLEPEGHDHVSDQFDPVQGELAGSK